MSKKSYRVEIRTQTAEVTETVHEIAVINQYTEM